MPLSLFFNLFVSIEVLNYIQINIKTYLAYIRSSKIYISVFTMCSFQESNSNWTKLSISLTDEVLEPLIAYQKPFPDVKVSNNFIPVTNVLVISI